MLTGIAIFVVLVVALLAIPVAVDFDINRQVKLVGDVYVRWLFGLVRIRIPVGAEESAPTMEDETTQIGDVVAKNLPVKSRSPKKRKNDKIRIGALLRNARFRHRILRFLSKLWSACHKRAVTISILFGFDDPVDTGYACAIAGSVSQLIAWPEDGAFHLEPVFTEQTLELDAHGAIWFMPVRLIVLVFGLIFSPSIWVAVFKAR